MRFDESASLLETVLRGEARGEILNQLCKSKTLRDAFLKLRASMKAHAFNAGSRQVSLAAIVHELDERTRQDGFTVLIDWDGKLDRWNEEMIPVDVLDYILRGVEPQQKIGDPERVVLAILLDYYLLYVIALFAMRVADDDNAPANVERVNGLIADLQGPRGSGQRHVDHTGTLILVATAHFEPDATAYERLIARIRDTWTEEQQLRIALVHAAILGSHLRHGFRDVYKKDLSLMRADNGPDYPCLLFALLRLMRTYAQGVQGERRERVVESILNGLTADPRAFIGKPPAPLANYAAEQSEFAALFMKHKDGLFQEFEAHRPTEQHYSALAFSFNFPHNLLKGIVIHALFKRTPFRVSVDNLLSGTEDGVERITLARALMRYSQVVPDDHTRRPVPVIEYDPYFGIRSMNKTLSTIREMV